MHTNVASCRGSPARWRARVQGMVQGVLAGLHELSAHPVRVDDGPFRPDRAGSVREDQGPPLGCRVVGRPVEHDVRN